MGPQNAHPQNQGTGCAGSHCGGVACFQSLGDLAESYDPCDRGPTSQAWSAVQWDFVREGPGLPVKIEEQVDKAQLVAVPTLYDELHKWGLRTAAIDWPCTRNSTSLDDDFPDTPNNVLYTTPRLRKELLSAGILADERDFKFRALTSPGRDEVWTKAACHVIKTRRPHLLLLHLLNTDGINHQYGPGSAASYTALALADSLVGELLDALDAAGIRKNTTVFVLADHGFATATKLLQPNVLFRQAGLLEIGDANREPKARGNRTA